MELAMSAPTLARAAHQLPVEAPIAGLDQHTQDRIRQLMEAADDTDLIDVRRARHAQVADLMGIQFPPTRELALCTCAGCYCDTVFDAWLAVTYQDGTVERVQCPACADDHRHTGE